jgi:hypothetical protein
MRAIVFAVLLAFSTASEAATAFLVRCDIGMSVTGRTIYIGTYQYAGRYFKVSFDHYCPPTIEVY